MNFFRSAPVWLSFLLLGAHFFRGGTLLLAAACAVLPLLLFLRRAWVARLAQVLLVLGGLEWLRTLIALAMRRQAAGEPWLRLAVILGVVAVFTLASALVFQARALRRRYFAPEVPS
jgi:hypothetical protein